ncbi:MAG: hypothetical protein ACRD1Y_14275 [Terriglobales bacterium]
MLSASRVLADYFERAAAASPNPKAVANWIMGDLMAHAKSIGHPAPINLPPEHIAELVSLIDAGTISGKMAKDVFAAMLAQHEAPGKLVAAMGLQQISDTGALEAIVDEVIAAHPQQAQQYRAGKTSLLAFFVGQVMKASRGQASPPLVNELLKRKLD